MNKYFAAAAVVSVLAAAGCSSSDWNTDDSAPVTYAPVSYWASVNNVRECYYFGTDMNSGLAQVYALENSGLCPMYAMPVQMPVSLAEEYFDYFSSAAYYDTYVPAAYRRTYVSVTCVHFHQTYSTQISRLSRTAVYRSSNGSTTHGTPNSTSFVQTRKTVTYTVPRQSSVSKSYSSGRK